MADIALVNPSRPLSKGVEARCFDMSTLPTSGCIPTGDTTKPYNGGVRFINGDTLIARITPCLENGKAAYINILNEGEVAFGSTEYIVFASKDDIPSCFYYFLIRNSKFVTFALQFMNGSSGRQRVSGEELASFPLMIPSKEKLAAFNKVGKLVLEQMKESTEEIQFLKQLQETIKEEFELILVDDGSRDRSFAVMQELREKDPHVKIIQMARNFGQHPALLCGFAHAKGEFIVTMDDDLQHQPEELPKMINVMKERDDVDVIIASYEGRKHNLIRKLGTKLSVWATSKMLGKDPNLQITSYRLIRRFLVEAMLKTNTYLPQIGNLLVLSSNRIINVPVQHAARAYGKSGYSFRRLVKDLIYDITAHTAFPLLMVRNIGIASFLVSFLLGIYYLVRYFLCGISVEGWTSLMLVMLAFFGLTLLSIGIIGIYLMNILNEAKKMPHYVIRQEETD